MARNVIDGTGWLVEGKDSNVVKAFTASSAWEQAARPIAMTGNTVRVPRIADMGVAVIPKGAAYPEDQSGADTVAISAVKIGQALRIAEEDVEDEKLADYIGIKKTSAGSSFAKFFDNAAIGVNAVDNDGTVPFTSLYKALTTADATTSYTANQNVLTGAALTYDVINQLLSIVEQTNFYDESQISVLASPAFRTVLRGIKDGQGRPMFFDDLVNGTSVPRIMGLPIRYTIGARVSTVATSTPGGAGGAKGAAGNPLFAIVNKAAAINGTRKAFESVYISGRDGLSALTDEDILKVRARKAAGVTTPQAHALFELTSA